jgi:hypothetical protein
MKARWLLSVTLLAGLALLTGCSGDNTAEEVAAMNKSNILRLANLYSGFQNGFAGGNSGGPKDENEFKNYITNYPADKLKMMGVDPANLDGLFKSERDGKSFKIRYKVGGGRGSVAPVIFETEGKDGKKQVAFAGDPKIEDCDQATYDAYLTGKQGVQGPGSPGGAPAGGGGRPAGGGRPEGAPTGPPG